MKVFNDQLFDPTVNGLTRALDLTYQRNEAISSNIANAETPQYRASDVTFANELDRAFNHPTNEIIKTNSKHLDLESSQSAHLVADFSGATKPDGNNVDIDIQMGRLAYNSGKYALATSLLRKKFQFIANALRTS